jgi:hypothetical protein
VIRSVDALEASGSVPPLLEELPPERLLESEPAPGDVVALRELQALGAKELRLSNGMLVVFRHSELHEDELLLSVRCLQRVGTLGALLAAAASQPVRTAAASCCALCMLSSCAVCV